MDMQAEMEKYQAEMMAIQVKYAAEPTPENMAKMQQEMAVLSQKMSELSMQYAAAAMTDTYGDAAQEIMAQAYAGVEAEGFDLYGEDDGEETAQFVLDNPVPPDKAKYLPIGALLLCSNGEPLETFALMGSKEDWLEALESGWGFEDAEDGREMLASLLEGRHESVYGEEYRKFRAGKSHELDEDSVEGYGETLEGLKEELPSLYPYAQSCGSLLAWDLERAGFLARIFTHLGWMDQTEAFDWMEKTAAKIKAAFSCWEEYFASVLVGRAVAYQFDYQMIGAACELIEDYRALLEEYPISAL